MGKVITLGRQFGSGGREIGKILADELGFAFYDKELINKAAESSGIHRDFFERNEESVTGNFFHALTMGIYRNNNRLAEMNDISINDKVYLIQADVIKKAAEEGDAVIVGRCADYVLRNHKDCYNVFIHGDIEDRVRRATEDYGLDPDGLKETIIKIDKKRASYYNYYSGKKWGKAISYHMTLDSGVLGIRKCVDLIKELIRE
ncbi:MAG: cytidylate kinase-like family protein [Bacillota bacterium]|nr:cytidylate kinase-like family protein [Bacillota bacterium]